MQTALDAQADGFSNYEKNLVSNIREHGWFCTSVLGEAGCVGFSYSTGFWVTLNCPELIVFSLGDAAHDILWDVFDAIRAGKQFPVGERIRGIFKGLDAFLAPVSKDHYAKYILSAGWFYGNEDFPCLQLIWPDTAGLFPWEPGADAKFAENQPDLSPEGWTSFAH